PCRSRARKTRRRYLNTRRPSEKVLWIVVFLDGSGRQRRRVASHFKNYTRDEIKNALKPNKAASSAQPAVSLESGHCGSDNLSTQGRWHARRRFLGARRSRWPFKCIKESRSCRRWSRVIRTRLNEWRRK